MRRYLRSQGQLSSPTAPYQTPSRTQQTRLVGKLKKRGSQLGRTLVRFTTRGLYNIDEDPVKSESTAAIYLLLLICALQLSSATISRSTFSIHIAVKESQPQDPSLNDSNPSHRKLHFPHERIVSTDLQGEQCVGCFLPEECF